MKPRHAAALALGRPRETDLPLIRLCLYGGRISMPEPSKRNPFPWLPFWPKVEESPRKIVLAILILGAIAAACFWPF